MKEKIENTQKNKIYILVYILIVLAQYGATLYYNLGTLPTYRSLALLILMLFLCFFVNNLDEKASSNKNKNDYVGRNNRFYVSFFAIFALSILFPLFVSEGWPFLVIALVLLMFSTPLRGLLASTTILANACLLSQVDFGTFMFHFVCIIAVTAMFSTLNDYFKIQIPLLLSLLCYILSAFANVIIVQNANLSIALLMVPLIGLFINTVLMLIFLWYYYSAFVSKKRDQYIIINDPEYELMTKLKQKDEGIYKEAIHTAYLCNKISTRLGLNADVVRAAGFYLHAGRLIDNDDVQSTKSVLEEYHFPQDVTDAICEAKNEKYVLHKECCVAAMSDLVLRAIISLKAKNAEAKINYELIITQLFELKTKSHYFDKCNISFSELNAMKNIMIKEDLYYELIH